MENEREDAAPPGEHASEASGEQQGRGEARPELDDPPAVSGLAGLAEELNKPAVAVPGRRVADSLPINRAEGISQEGVPQNEDPRSASGLTASEIAVIAYTAVQVYKEAIEQEPRDWHAIQALDRKEIVGQVVAAMIGQSTTASRNHAIWAKNMKARGLTVEDNPFIGMLFGELPQQERRKAYIFEAVVRTLLADLPA